MIKIGHRGACGYEAENTLKSYQKAIDLGVDMIECDAQMTKDGRVVMVHDYAIRDMVAGKVWVKDLTYDEITEFVVDESEMVPTLEEVLDLVKGKTKLNIELKDPKAMQKIVQLIEDRDMTQDVILSVWYTRLIREARMISPNMAVAYLFWKARTLNGQGIKHCLGRLFLPITLAMLMVKIKKNKIKIVSLSKFLATRWVVNTLHKNGIKVYVWTLNEPGEIELMKKFGVDGIISNYPDRI